MIRGRRRRGEGGIGRRFEMTLSAAVGVGPEGHLCAVLISTG